MGSRYWNWRLCASESEENADLYWALSGDGGGTYGVVWSLTSKAHVDIPVSGANLTFSSEGIMTDTYYAALTAWHKNLPKLVNTGAMTIYYVTSVAFILTPFTGPGIPASKAKELLQPFVDELNILEIAYNMTGPTGFPTYLDEFNTFQLSLSRVAQRSTAARDAYQPNWQETFYGVNYPRLRSIKAKYDPNDIFYATTAVGSDGWEIESPGRLCRVST
ncbi:MAG: hypothetical protein Q9175_005292 [Cornicularia normoerica]